MSRYLKPGLTYADMLDNIEAATVEYMQTTRGIDEKAMRTLLESDAEVRASYERKIERAIEHGIRSGAHPSVFGRKA